MLAQLRRLTVRTRLTRRARKNVCTKKKRTRKKKELIRESWGKKDKIGSQIL